MKQEASHIAHLYYKSLAGSLTAEESQEWLNFREEQPELADYLAKLEDSDGFSMAFTERVPARDKERSENRLERILNHLEITKPKNIAPIHRIHLLKTAWIRYAAAIILILGIGAYLWKTQQKEKTAITETTPALPKTDIAPGNDRAVLTLSQHQVSQIAAAESLQ